ncbi:Crp/Fnr family transcriptional regulator [Portibacter marinus]|uniref:Crp/Fnr family transcriptional regulator n=1 Tax=Portibacter marinus TaxID=2898660 RepID=UPI001F41FAD5|nr:Crp/Fnr family transcriptional regulator [Portibacter marinus]
MTELTNFIQAYFPIPLNQVETLASYFKYKTLDKGDFFLKSGSYCNELSFILDGHLRIFETVEGREVTQWISSRGDFITDIASLVFDQPGRRNIQALKSVELYSIYKEDYDRLPLIIPHWERIEKQFLAKCFLTLEDRIFSFLSMDSAQRFQQMFAYKPELFNEVPLHYLASMLGMTPETLSRIRSKV